MKEYPDYWLEIIKNYFFKKGAFPQDNQILPMALLTHEFGRSNYYNKAMHFQWVRGL